MRNGQDRKAVVSFYLVFMDSTMCFHFCVVTLKTLLVFYLCVCVVLPSRSVSRETLPVGKQHVWSIFARILMWRYVDPICP